MTIWPRLDILVRALMSMRKPPLSLTAILLCFYRVWRGWSHGRLGNTHARGVDTAKYGKAYLWKALLNGLPVAALLLLTARVAIGLALAYAFALTVLAYLIGDLLILPPFGNAVATLADGGLAFVTVFSLRTYGVYVDSLHAVLVAGA